MIGSNIPLHSTALQAEVGSTCSAVAFAKLARELTAQARCTREQMRVPGACAGIGVHT